MNKTTILFDLFFTLVVPEYSAVRMDNEYSILGFNQIEWENLCSDTYTQRATGKIKSPVEMMEFILAGRDIPSDKIENATNARLNRYINCMTNIDPSVINALKELRYRGYNTAIISNSDIIDIISWNHSPLKSYFDDAIFSYNVGVMKPQKDIYQFTLSRLNEKAKNCIFVGDGGHQELLGAKQIGMTTVLTTQFIKNYWPEQIEELKINVDHVVDDLWELIEIL